MAKGSQLVQLKSALAQVGVLGQKPNTKKRKRSSLPVEKEKEKTAAKLEDIHRRLNPFDEKVTKLKHDVGGRRLKGISGKPAKSKQAGLDQRRKTLLKEWEDKGRAGGIVDRRFGENDPSMGLEERMLERFTRERQRTSTSAAFNIEDEDELTHYGESLSKLDDFDGAGFKSESEDEDAMTGQLDRELVSKTHFGGFDEAEEDVPDSGEPPRKKTKAEVMAEVMAKSKLHKQQRQAEKEFEENVRFKLDNQFADLRDLLFASKPLPTLAGSGEESSGAAQDPDAAILASVPETQDGEYDQRVRELAFDKRAKPKDRTKTEEEQALEAKEALEKAERRRQRRMQGLQESDSEDEGGRGRGGKPKRGGDDLEDDFFDEGDDWEGLGAGLKTRSSAVQSDADYSGEEGEDDDGGEGEEEGGGEGSGIDLESEAEGEEVGEHEELVRYVKGKGSGKAASEDIPYTFPCPRSHDEFLEIMGGIDEKHTSLVVQRIRALFHTSLSPDNKFKLQGFGCVLIDHILYSASMSPPQFNTMATLYHHLHAITKAYPIPIARHFNEKLSLMHKNLKRGISHGVQNAESRTWPGLGELAILRVIGQMWPTSDLHHAVISPARVLMGAYLGLCRVRSLSDIASGLFLCTLWLQFEGLSKHLVPEVINFLVNTLLHLTPHRIETVASIPGHLPSPDFRSRAAEGLTLKKSKWPLAPQTPNLTSLLSLNNASNEQAKSDLISLAIDLLSRFTDMYKDLAGFVEVFDPVKVVLEAIEQEALHSVQEAKLNKGLDALRRLLKFSRETRQPLHLQSHKPIPIPTYVPKFESTTSNYLRQRDPDYEKNQVAKLKNQYKQEKKGAIRELRKDARFLASVEQQKQVEKDKAYNDRLKKAYTSIEPERAEQKAAEKEKAKEKRRSGKR